MASSLVAVLCLWTLWVCALIYGSRTKITHTEFKLSDSEQFLMTDKGYVFDTGANVSLLVDTQNMGSSHWLCPIFLIDSNLHYTLKSLYYGGRCQIGENLHILGFVFGTEKETVHSKVFPFIKGIMSMNIIHKANWLYSLKLQKAETFPLDSIVPVPDDVVTLSYRRHLRPLADLDINGHLLKNVLIDTGFDEDLLLKDGTDATINLGEAIQQDSVERIAINSKQMLLKKVFKSVRINSQSYQNLKVIFGGNSRNLLGLGFMRRFDYLFWDSKHKKVYLWNEKPSENI